MKSQEKNQNQSSTEPKKLAPPYPALITQRPEWMSEEEFKDLRRIVSGQLFGERALTKS